MGEDRFGDLDPERRDRRPETTSGPAAGRQEPDDAPADATQRGSAAEQLAELDAQADREQGERPSPAPTGSRYGWVVGVAAFLLIAFAAVNTLPNSGRGRDGPQRGEVLPDFAAPSLRGGSDADANIRQAAGGSSEQGLVPACDVEGGEVVNICDLRRRPVVLTFVAPGCEGALDVVETVRGDYPGVSFVGVVIGESAPDAAELAGGRDWGSPVAVDPDNAVFNLYRAADCPTTVTAEAGGEVVATRNGSLTEDELRDAVSEVAPAAGGDGMRRGTAG